MSSIEKGSVEHVEDIDAGSRDHSSTTDKPGILESFDSLRERQLVSKVDRHVIPVVMVLYLVSFLDRVNIGNARLYGMEADLGMHGNMYQASVSVLFVTYLIFEIPSNLVLKKLTPSRYIAGICIIWGIIATLMGLVKTYGQLLALRLLLGIFEAGLFPGMTVYLTFWYTRRELAVRISYLFVSAALAGACGGLLAYAIGKMEGLHGMSGWRWIFIIEGIPSVLVGIASYFVLPDGPDHAYFLTEEEKQMMRLRKSREVGQSEDAQKFHWKDVRAAAFDWKVWAFGVGQFGVNTILYGFSVFLPTVLQQIGSWSREITQVLTIPCYFLGAVTYLLVARASDATQKRGLFCVMFGSVSLVGYIILISPGTPASHYVGTFLVATGLYVFVGIPIAWLPNNMPRYGKRATATGIQLTIGNSAGVSAPFIYRTADRPRYILGHSVSLGTTALSTAIFAFLWWWFSRENTAREAGRRNKRLEDKTPEEINMLGDEHPEFRYMA